MKEFVIYLIKNLVDQPEEVKVDIFEGAQTIVIEVRVAEGDVARVIGRQGNTIKALRTLAATVAARFSKKIRLELVE